MKKKFTKILGVGLTLALLTSLLLTAAPVSALTKPSVTVDDPTISVETDYSIVFALGARLGGTSTLSFSALSDRVVTVATGAAATATLTWPALTTVTTSGTSGAVIPTSNSITFTGAGVTQAAETVVLTLTAGAVSNISVGGGAAGTATTSETALPTDSIIIEFDEDTDITGVETANVTVAATSGIGTPAWGPETVNILEADIVDQELTIAVPLAIGVGAMVEVVVSGVENPGTAGDYTLDVSTTNEAAVTSSAYKIEVPTIPVLPGIVKLYNPSNVLMNQYTGDTAINVAITAAKDDYTIVVGAGEYEIATTITITQEGLTLKSSAGATTTIIVADAGFDVILITGADVTVDGFTIQDTEDSYTAIKVTGDDAIVQNNVMTAEDGYPEGISIEASAAGATVSGNVLDIYHTMMVQNTASGCTLSDNIFGAGINLHNDPSDITITGNTLIGSELWGIVLWDGNGSPPGTYTDILIEGNTISETTLGDAIGICVQGTAVATNLQIIGNDITDNEGVGIQIDSAATLTDSVIKFNTITGNDADNDGYGINNATDTDVDATLNWWGTAIAADIADMVSTLVTYEPFLADTVDAVFSATKVAVGEDSLDAKDTVGVRVSGATDATVIAVAKYIANPQEAISDAIAFFDVYAAGVTNPTTTEVTIKFYAGDANTVVYIWSAENEVWAALDDADYSVYGGYVYVDVLADLLDGTPFALVAGTVAAPDAPEILAPTAGADDVSLTPIFAWKAVPDVGGYYFQLADNANFVTPMVKLDGDLGRLVVTAYAYVGELPYSTAYYWRVQAVSGTVAAGTLAESAWSTGVFITMAEPVEPTPPVEGPPVVIEPIVEVIVPATTEITPAWIYVIIGVGGVLVIALLVLIVRTRRVA